MKRQTLVLLMFLGGFLLVAAKLFYWQVIVSERLVEAARDQYFFSLNLPPARGKILASDGSPMVTNKTAYLVYGEPKQISDRNIFVNKVTETLKLSKEDLIQKLAQANIVWVSIAHRVDEGKAQELKSMSLPGLGFEKEAVRFYPEGSMAAQLMGFVGSDTNGQDKGYFGLEGFYDRALKGKPGSLLQEKDAQGLPLLLGTEKRIPAENGQDLELYLDRSVQLILENRLQAGLQKYGAKAAMVAVMDPKTGGILGTAALPKYAPAEFNKASPQSFPNPLVANTYEPGSTFKALVMAAALNEKVVKPETKYNETGPVPVGEYLIRTWNSEYHGDLTMTQVLEKSSNPGMVFVGQKLGKDKMLDYLNKFGFGQKSGIDLEEEAAPGLRSADDWKEIDLATASFGQGIAVTPIQMLRAVGVLSNQGKLMQPLVVKKIIDVNGKVIENKPRLLSEVIKPATAQIITEMLIAAVDNGEAKWAKPKGYRIAGKTGTAQIAVSGHYDDKKTIASFVGYATADDPKFVMLVLLQEPTSSPWGSETAAPLFFDIAKDLFAYYSISPKD